jgi:periplasmic protein TonB
MTARTGTIVRWGACFTLVLGFHAAGAAALLAHWHTDTDAVANAPAITIELAPLPVAPEIKPTELPPGPQQAEVEPQPEPDPVKPVETIELPPQPQPEVFLAVTPPPKTLEKPKEKKPKQMHASLASAPASAERKAQRAAAPAPGAAARDANAAPNWKSLLVATLERNKRYPAEAEARGEHGTAELAFTVDRRGGVHRARIVRSSGSGALDRETLAMLQRAAPLPPPPPEVAGTEIPVMVPIRYNLP